MDGAAELTPLPGVGIVMLKLNTIEEIFTLVYTHDKLAICFDYLLGGSFILFISHLIITCSLII